MTEYSGFWTTDDATPEGDQVASYDQAYWTYAGVIFGACNAKEGVAPNYLGELEGPLPRTMWRSIPAVGWWTGNGSGARQARM